MGFHQMAFWCNGRISTRKRQKSLWSASETPEIKGLAYIHLIGSVPSYSKESVISPLPKKPTLDKDQLSNYRPIFNLSLISKIIE